MDRANARVAATTAHITRAPTSAYMEDVVNQTPYRAALRACRDDLWKFIDETNANPIFVRLAWHDAGTFDYHVRSWPKCGGANGSIRFEEEMSHGANAGLSKALKYLEPFKAKHPLLSYADVIQLAGATAIEHAGGPKIKMRYGRVDVETPEECAREGNLPGAEPPFGDGSPDAATHLRRVLVSHWSPYDRVGVVNAVP